MAFLNRVGSVLKQTVSKQIGSSNGSQISASNPSIYLALRCMSSGQLFVGGLSSTVDDSGLRKMFSEYGKVISAKVVIDKEQNKSRGFGFVSFASTEEASTAIEAMDGQSLQGRKMKVNHVASKAPSGGGFSGGYGAGSADSGASQVIACGKSFPGNDAGDSKPVSKPTGKPKANFKVRSDAEPDDFVKRAYSL